MFGENQEDFSFVMTDPSGKYIFDVNPDRASASTPVPLDETTDSCSDASSHGFNRNLFLAHFVNDASFADFSPIVTASRDLIRRQKEKERNKNNAGPRKAESETDLVREVKELEASTAQLAFEYLQSSTGTGENETNVDDQNGFNCVMCGFGPPPLMAYVTTRPVRKGEEFLASYGLGYWLGKAFADNDEVALDAALDFLADHPDIQRAQDRADEAIEAALDDGDRALRKSYRKHTALLKRTLKELKKRRRRKQIRRFLRRVIGGLENSDTGLPSSPERIDATNEFPPWIPSPNIDKDGFLVQKYNRTSGDFENIMELNDKDEINFCNSPATVRQVPGDGSCLFHSISLALAHSVYGTHMNIRSPNAMEWLYQESGRLRQLAVNCLEEPGKVLFLQGDASINATDLVEKAATQYSISGSNYCESMREESSWGGGPEIVALCDVLERPIHVYELHVPENERERRNMLIQPNFILSSVVLGLLSRTIRSSKIAIPVASVSMIALISSIISASLSSSSSSSSSFVLRRMACFGSPKYDQKPTLHILSADSRFPDVRPGSQLESGNHFYALFPEQM